jgi:putative transposase
LSDKAGAAVALEDLKVAQMIRRPKAKPVVDGEGNVVRFEKNRAAQKAGLNKAILNVGWGDFRTLIEYKLRERNKFLATVSPEYTSQECSKCAHVDAGNRRTQEHFQCLQCGHTDNADTNASKIIKKRFLTQLRNGTLPPKGKASKKIAARRKPGAVTPTEVRCQPVEPCVRLGSNPERGRRSRKGPLAREACSGYDAREGVNIPTKLVPFRGECFTC